MENFIERIIDILNIDIVNADHTLISTWWAPYAGEFPFVRIYLVTEGDAKFTLIGGNLHLEAGMMYLVPSHKIITGNCENVMDHYWIHVMTDPLTEDIITYSGIQAVKAPKYAQTFFDLIVKNVEQPTEYSPIFIKNSLKLIFAEFFKNGMKIDPDFLRFGDTIDYIEKNLENDITLGDLAANMHLHPTYFSNLFSKVFKQPPMSYVTQKKLNLACKYLATELSIREIAEKLHFYDVAYFSHVFKSHFTLSPSQFRMRLQEDKGNPSPPQKDGVANQNP